MARMSQAVEDRINGVHANFSNRLDKIRGSEHLSPAGKQAEIAKAYQPYRTTLDTIKASLGTDTNTRADQIEQTLFGTVAPTGSDVISFRDAQDRASRIESPEEAQQVLARARQSGDQQLMKAVGRHIFDNLKTPILGAGWGRVAQDWADGIPGAAEQLNELRSIQDNTMQTAFYEAALFHPQVPNELRGFHDGQIEQLATQPTAV